MPDPKDDRKGVEPKDDRKGTDPKDDRKGAPSSGLGAQGCGNGSTVQHILQSAADLCGFLVVAVVAPMSGGGAQPCSPGESPRQQALSELRRKAEIKLRDALLNPPSAVQASGAVRASPAALAARAAAAAAVTRPRRPRTAAAKKRKAARTPPRSR